MNMARRGYLLCAGILLASYAGLTLWVNTIPPDSRIRRALCESWFCPVEFSPGRASDLHRTACRTGPVRSNGVQTCSKIARRLPTAGQIWQSLGNVPASYTYAAESAATAGPHSPGILLRAGIWFSAGYNKRALHFLVGYWTIRSLPITIQRSLLLMRECTFPWRIGCGLAYPVTGTWLVRFCASKWKEKTSAMRKQCGRGWWPTGCKM